MMILLILVIIVVMFGGGYYGYRTYGAPYGGGWVGFIVIIVLILYLTGNLHGVG
jgi:hypothetical protein